MRLRSPAALAAAALLLSSLATHALAAGLPRPNAAPHLPSPLLAWKPRPWSPPARTVTTNGLWVHRDPVDGTLGMPDAATLARLSTIGDADAPVPIDRLPDGTLSAHLDDRFADFAVATKDAHGKPAWKCVPGKKAATAFVTKPVIVAPPSTPRAEK